MDRFDTSRPDQSTDVVGSATVFASMRYLGLGTLIELTYDGASDLKLTYQNGGTGTAGDKYTGLDLFGRIVETIWIKGTGDVVQSLYGHNRASSILWRKDEEASNTIAMDAYYEYDGLQQVTEWKRGNLSPSTGPPFTGVTSQKQGEDFTYDQTGNWLGDVSDNPNFTQSRTHNVNNQITAITGPAGVIQPAYDNAGNTTLAPSPGSWTIGYTYKWDAWNRLVEIKQGGTVIGSYAYDALTRRTRKTVGGVTRDIYYDRQWRSVEERDTSTGTVKLQHAWSPLDRWTLIRRKRNASGSTLNETLFCLRDYLDPVSLANTSGNVVERYSYDAFGTVRIMNAAFGVLGNSAYDWEFLYHGEFRDKESELYNYGYRYLDTQLGRWLSRDPIGEYGGENLYVFVSNRSSSSADYIGLSVLRAANPRNINIPCSEVKSGVKSRRVTWQVTGVQDKGIIVQTYTITGSVTDCKSGETVVVPQRDRTEYFVNGDDDLWQVILPKCTSGTINFLAGANYIEGYTIPRDASKGDIVSGQAPSVPGFRRIKASSVRNISNLVTRNFTVTWNCCPKNKKS